MKQIIYISFLLYSILTFGQIGDPTPNFDSETFTKPEPPGGKWDFSKKPYKKIINSENSKCIDEFDSIGRHTKRSVFWNHVTEMDIIKYKGDQVVERTHKQIYNFDKNGKKINLDYILTYKLNINDKGKIIDGKTFKLTKDSIYKIVGYQYYDKKNRLTKSIDSTGHKYISNFYYSGKNLIRNEEINQIDAKTKAIVDRTYKYNKDNQIVLFESIRSIFKNNILTEKKSSQTVQQEFKNNQLVKKVLKSNSETIERNYTYDNNRNLTIFIETKKNNYDGLIRSQMKETKKYENNLLVYSEVQEGLGKQEGNFSFTYYFHSDKELLEKTETTYDKGNEQVKYFYNGHNHLIKTITTYSDEPSRYEVLYEIEYY
ncbi:hypothetical protein [Flavobacterium aquicola]|uniref:YD repeat-containing protein n=1 Tax=Flavobacterium aquicola TaxID=1682742 RepID=A0A3E0DYM8_9FLAO|nr:hypothetical protein [Flavobacterium aquicola]REG91128.1 hypothetical protein C8P67_11721 [Flavobacterium aquicola]